MAGPPVARHQTGAYRPAVPSRYAKILVLGGLLLSAPLVVGCGQQSPANSVANANQRLAASWRLQSFAPVVPLDLPLQAVLSAEIGTLLVECANLVGRALPLLQSIGDNVSMLTQITEELTKLEGRVDDLHDIGLKELFLKHRNANTMDFIVGAEIYDHLEKVADRFDDVANEINSIVIEQV